LVTFPESNCSRQNAYFDGLLISIIPVYTASVNAMTCKKGPYHVIKSTYLYSSFILVMTIQWVTILRSSLHTCYHSAFHCKAKHFQWYADICNSHTCKEDLSTNDLQPRNRCTFTKYTIQVSCKVDRTDVHPDRSKGTVAQK
jgi:hypothetical protein